MTLERTCQKDRKNLAGAGGLNAAPGRVHILAVLGLLLVLVGMVYAGTLRNEFVYDDRVLIAQNDLLRRLDSIPQLFVTDWWKGVEEEIGRSGIRLDGGANAGDRRYRPLVAVTYVLNYVVGGAEPWGYHLVNLLLHAGVTCLLFLLARELGWPSGPAVVAAGLFAVHPLHTEAVAWVVGRPELLMSLSVLGSLWCAVRGLRVMALIAFALGLLSKEQAVMVPALLLLIDVCRGGLYVPGQAWTSWLHTALKRYSGYLAVLVTYLVLRTAVMGGFSPPVFPFLENPLEHAHGLAWVLTLLKLDGRYLWLTLWPATLSVDYSYNAIPAAASILDIGVLWSLAAWGSLAVLAVWSYRRDPRVTLAIGLTVLAFVPASNVFFTVGTPLAERLFYLPLAGPCLLVGLAWERAVGAAPILATGRIIPLRAALASVMVIIFLALTVRTIQRIHDWANNETLFRSAVQVMPGNAKAHAILADALRMDHGEGAMAQALAEYQAALALYPEYPHVSPHFATNYGHTLLDLGHTSEAVAAFEQAVAAKPRWSRMHYNLGLVYARLGQYDKAQHEWDQAALLNPDDPQVHSSLSRLAIERGQFDQALVAADRALGKGPELVMAVYNRALALEGLGRLDEAAQTYERVLRSPAATEEVKQDVTRKLRSLQLRRTP